MSVGTSRSSSTTACSASAVAVALALSGKASHQAAYFSCKGAVRRPHRAIAVVWRVDPPGGDSESMMHIGPAINPSRVGHAGNEFGSSGGTAFPWND